MTKKSPFERFQDPLWAAAGGLLLVGGLGLVLTDRYGWGSVLTVLGLIGCLSALLRERLRSLAASPRTDLPAWVKFLFLTASVLAGGIGQSLLSSMELDAGAGVLVAAVLLAACAFFRPSPELDRIRPLSPTAEGAIFGAVLLLAAFFRFSELPRFPPAHWFDEANNCLLALDLERMAPTPFLPNLGQPSAWNYLLLLWMKLFGREPWVTRTLPALFGWMTVPVLYFLMRRIAGPRTALVGAFLLAVSRWHVNFSRIDFNAIQVPFFEAIILYYLWRGIKEGTLRHWAMSGLALGSLFNSYLAGRLFAAVLLLFLLGTALIDRGFLRRQWKGLTVAMTVTLVLSLPLLLWASMHAGEFLKRTREVMLSSSYPPAEIPAMMARHLRATLLQFGVLGDHNGRHNLPHAPLMDPVTTVVCTLGVGLAFLRTLSPLLFRSLRGRFEVRPEEERGSLIFLWAAVMALPGVVTIEAPQALRTIGCLPAVIAAGALFLGRAWDLLHRVLRPDWERYSALAILGLAGWIGAANYDSYFLRQAQSQAVHGFYSPSEHSIGVYMKHLDGRSRIFSDHAYYPPTTFAAGTRTPHDYFEPWQDVPLTREQYSDVTWLLMPTYGHMMSVFRYYYPEAVIMIYPDPWNEPLFYAVRVHCPAVKGRQGLAVGTAGRGTGTVPINTRLGAGQTANHPVRLTRGMYVPETDTYRFSSEGPFPLTLRVDGRPVGLRGEKVPLTRGQHAVEITTRIRTGTEVSLLFQSSRAKQFSAIPASYFTPLPPYPRGLLGRYTEMEDEKKAPVFQMVDPAVDFQWGLQGVISRWTVEWTGEVLAERSGTYSFGFFVNQPVRLEIDGRQVLTVDNGESRASVELAQGWHPVRIVFKAHYAASEIHWWWIRPGEGEADKEVVGEEYLRSRSVGYW